MAEKNFRLLAGVEGKVIHYCDCYMDTEQSVKLQKRACSLEVTAMGLGGSKQCNIFS